MFDTGLWVLINQKAWFLLLLIPDCFCRTKVNFWVVFETTVLCMVLRDKDECWLQAWILEGLDLEPELGWNRSDGGKTLSLVNIMQQATHLRHSLLCSFSQSFIQFRNIFRIHYVSDTKITSETEQYVGHKWSCHDGAHSLLEGIESNK